MSAPVETKTLVPFAGGKDVFREMMNFSTDARIHVAFSYTALVRQCARINRRWHQLFRSKTGGVGMTFEFYLLENDDDCYSAA